MNKITNLKAALFLKNGHIFIGDGIGKPSTIYGECVFTTGMTGYNESLTDPSYAGQILCFTYPLIGNYGVSASWSESNTMFAEGLIISDLSQKHFHPVGNQSLEDFLVQNNKSGIVGADTRKLTKILRTEGNQNSILIVDSEENIQSIMNRFQAQGFDSLLPNIDNPQDIGFLNWPHRVNINSTDLDLNNAYNPSNQYQKINKKIVIIDCGVKGNIVRELKKRFTEVVILPSSSSFENIIKENPDGILLSNGPGDPRDYNYIVDLAKQILEAKIPLMGICLGHQIISLAIGAKIYKMKFGNRGGNQPVQEQNTLKAYLTSQNHGYATDESSIPSDYKVLFKNLNDGTVEGLESNDHKVFSVQFHPEACSGPQDTNWLFDKFVDLI